MDDHHLLEERSLFITVTPPWWATFWAGILYLIIFILVGVIVLSLIHICGEIRDRMGGGKGSWPIAGTAVYMTSYPRTDEGREWEERTADITLLFQNIVHFKTYGSRPFQERLRKLSIPDQLIAVHAAICITCLLYTSRCV